MFPLSIFKFESLSSRRLKLSEELTHGPMLVFTVCKADVCLGPFSKTRNESRR